MSVAKLILFNDKIQFKTKSISNIIFFYIWNRRRLLLKISCKHPLLLNNHNIVTLNKLNYYNCNLYVKTISIILEKLLYTSYKNFSKLYLIGLGFKNFILANNLYILVGDCNYIVFEIPASLKIYCKKNQIYILGENPVEMFNFMANIKRVKKSNFYKGKGLLQFKNFKFTKLKVGKKQRFM